MFISKVWILEPCNYTCILGSAAGLSELASTPLQISAYPPHACKFHLNSTLTQLPELFRAHVGLYEQLSATFVIHLTWISTAQDHEKNAHRFTKFRFQVSDSPLFPPFQPPGQQISSTSAR
jgi:hypothetical protein